MSEVDKNSGGESHPRDKSTKVMELKQRRCKAVVRAVKAGGGHTYC
jgi:hypothetical protein